MRTCADSYETKAWADSVALMMAQARGERAPWQLETDRIGTALLNGRIDEAAARERLIANGDTGREADHQLAQWRRPAVSLAGGDGYAQERADYCC